MKNKMYLLFVLLLALCLFSCSDVTKEDSSVLTGNNTRNIILEEEGLTYEDLDERNRYIDENYWLFEGIRVFDSSEELFSLVSEIEAMSYTDLENWCINTGIYSPILNSRIVYETVFADVLEEFGYSYDEYVYDENYIIEEETVFEVFKERMISDFSNYINIYEEYDEWYGAEYYIEPFSTDGFDELIFMNDRNMVIVGLNVYKLVGDIILSTSVYNFNEYFADLMYIEEVEWYLSSVQVGEEVFYTNLNSNSDNVEDLPFKWTEKGYRTKMKIKIKAFDFPNWKGNIIRHARLSVNNYKYGCWKRVYTSIDITVDLMGREDGEGNQTFLFQDGGKFFSKTCKSKYMMHSSLGSNIIYLTDIAGCVENNWGLSANF